MKSNSHTILLPAKPDSQVVAENLYLKEMNERLQKLRALLEEAETRKSKPGRRKRNSQSSRH